MQTIIISLALMISVAFSGFAQTPYQKGMRKALSSWQDGEPTEALNLLERIAGAEEDNWIPAY